MCFMYVVECVAACILALHPSALCIVYFHLHCALIFTPNEIMPKSPKVLTASGLKSQSPQDLVWKQTIVFIVLLIPPLHPPSPPLSLPQRDLKNVAALLQTPASDMQGTYSKPV